MESRHRAMKTMADESAFLVAEQDFCSVLALAIKKYLLKWLKVPDFTFLSFAVLNPCLSISSFRPVCRLVFIFFFLYGWLVSWVL